jgi:hypothetical protein
MMNSDISNSPERCSGHHHSSQQQQQQQQQRSSLLLSPPYNIAAAAAPTTTTTTTTTPITSSYHNTPLLPIKVTCLVKANDTSEENVLYSDRLGLRFRHILTDASQTVASFSKSIVEEHEFVKYVQAVCQDFAKGCNCDVMLCYGDDKKTRVIMRYLDHETSSQHGSCPGVGGVGGGVVRDEIMMFVRLVEKSDAATLSTTVLRAKGEREMNIISVVVVVICLFLFVWFVVAELHLGSNRHSFIHNEMYIFFSNCNFSCHFGNGKYYYCYYYCYC